MHLYAVVSRGCFLHQPYLPFPTRSSTIFTNLTWRVKRANYHGHARSAKREPDIMPLSFNYYYYYYFLNDLLRVSEGCDLMEANT